MPKFRNLEEALLAHATQERNYSERVWSNKTRCPGYGNKPGNPAWGQCGVTRNALCIRLARVSGYADSLSRLETGAAQELIRELDLLSTYFIQAGSEPMRESLWQWSSEPVRESLWQWRELIGDWRLVCVYGGGTTHTGQIFTDHCWTQVVPPGHVGDPNSGIIVDSTLDQFSPELPKVHVQRAKATDSPVTYQPEQFKLFGEHDTTSRLMKERLQIYLSKLRKDPFPLWGLHGNLFED